MAKLNITYSHEKEIFIVNKHKEELRKKGEAVTDVSSPGDEQKVSGSLRKLSSKWEKKEAHFIKQLNWFYDCDFKIDGWTAYMIRFPICPYWTPEKWFAVSFNPVPKAFKTIGHELFHQPFHLFWEEKCKKLLQKGTFSAGMVDSMVYSLKEALPELLNMPEFNLSDIRDVGHPEPGEQIVRYMLRRFYKVRGVFTFKEFLERTFG
ncbi:hypothetical protein KKB83_05540 [Patescibacteria group bacterium]|nr:hypothetical protein [Patescibacteria group bacterium]